MKINNDSFLDLKGLLQTQLKTLMIGTTYKCNLQCAHCGPDAGVKYSHIMTTDYIKKAITEFKDIGGTTIVLGGGEPFTRPDILDIIEFAISKDLFVNIETNGTLFNIPIINRLKCYKDNIKFSISIDSINSDNHDKFRGVKGVFDLTNRSIIYLRKNDLEVTVATVLNKYNKSEIIDIIDFFVKDLGCYHRLIPIISYFGRGKSDKAKDFILSNKEVLNFLNKFYFPKIRELRNAGKEKFLNVEMPRPFIPDDINIFTKCDGGFKMVGLGMDGRIGICHYATDNKVFNTNHLYDRSLLDIWLNDDLFIKLRHVSSENLKGVCGNCKHAEWCRGLCRITAYDIYKDINGPNTICQNFYNEGLFPNKDLVDIEKDCRF